MVSKSETIRQHLGAHLLLGLDIFIATEIISSAVSHFNHLLATQKLFPLSV